MNLNKYNKNQIGNIKKESFQIRRRVKRIIIVIIIIIILIIIIIIIR